MYTSSRWKCENSLLYFLLIMYAFLQFRACVGMIVRRIFTLNIIRSSITHILYTVLFRHRWTKHIETAQTHRRPDKTTSKSRRSALFPHTNTPNQKSEMIVATAHTYSILCNGGTMLFYVAVTDDDDADDVVLMKRKILKLAEWLTFNEFSPLYVKFIWIYTNL